MPAQRKSRIRESHVDTDGPPIGRKRAVVLVDGEHYVPNLIDSLQMLASRYVIQQVLFIGGTEKTGSFTSIKERIPFSAAAAFEGEAPDFKGIRKFFQHSKADLVVDLSDEPVLDYASRLRLVNLALHCGLEYQGADFSFSPHRFKRILSKPSIALWGTGKRIGKTAMGGFVARTLRQAGHRPGVVTLSRGGPDRPHVLRGDRVDMTPESLLTFQKEGFHAASDYFEDAITGGCITIGCRRCGGGMAGKPFFTVAEEGALMAEKNSEIDVVILEGSGASFPEIRADRVILMVSAGQDISGVAGYLGPYRVMGADLVVVGGCDPPIAGPERVSAMVRTVRELNPRAAIATVIFRPRPLGAVRGARVFYANTAPHAIVPLLVEHLQQHFGCQVTGWSNALSDREKLMEDMRGSGADADVFLTELKASAVSTVAVEGAQRGKKVVFCDNVPLVTDDGDVHELESAVLELLRRTGKERL